VTKPFLIFFIYPVICIALLYEVPISIAGTPHVAYVSLQYSNGSKPVSLFFNAYITTRPAEILTETSTGCGYDSESGQWYVQCGNFSTGWTAGEIIHVDFEDGSATEGSVEVTLTNQPSDHALTTILTRYSHQITIDTDPAGLKFIANGTQYTSPQTFTWEQGSSHILDVQSPQSGDTGTRYQFASWSHGEPQTHLFIVPESDITLYLNFYTQHMLTVISEYGNPSGQGWYDHGSNAPFGVTTPYPGAPGVQYIFSSWTGEGTGSFTGTDESHTVIMNNPITETAEWTTQVYLSTSVDPPGSGSLLPPTPGIWADITTLVPVYAVADTESGYIFSEWSGDITGKANPDTVLMNGPKSITALFKLNDTDPPILSDCFPSPGSISVPENAMIQLKIIDSYPGYGIDANSINISIEDNFIILNGIDQTGGNVSMDQDSLSYSVCYIPSGVFGKNRSVQINVQCTDLCSPPNALDSTFIFFTGSSHLTIHKIDTLDFTSNTIIDDTTGIGIYLPTGALTDTTIITIGSVDTLPELPDNHHAFGTAFYFGPDGLPFSKPITLQVPFLQSDLDSANVIHPIQIPIFNFSTTSGRWTILSNLRSTSEYIEVEINHFCYLSFVRITGTNIEEIESEQIIPSEHVLMQNYPNPFNTETIIQYHLPESGHITITIFNANGQKVKTLIDEERVSGIYQIVWDGCNERSNCVPSGIYYYIMKVKDFSKTMKAVFIK
jgi:hypothetical protein